MDFTLSQPSGIITLTTDFGTSDLYVGVMKGVILNINPHAQIVDITHAIPPQDVQAAAFLIDSGYHYFPPGTIHVVVVDPGVGSDRRAIVCQTVRQVGNMPHTFVCPDNGILSHTLGYDHPYCAVTVENPAYCLPQISNTFHGRDIFAPVAAHLSRGVPVRDLGAEVTDLVQFPVPTPQITNDAIAGHVIWRDHFGNVITNITHEILESIDKKNFVIKAGTATINHLNRSYAESEPGQVLAIIGSFGRLEISINQGNAAHTLGLKHGAPIKILSFAEDCD